MRNAFAPLADNAPWIVMKFGGSSVATFPCWQNIKTLVTSRRARGARVLIVVSALAGITDTLKALCTHTDRDKRIALVQTIQMRHRALLEQMTRVSSVMLDGHVQNLLDLAQSGPSTQNELAWQAQVQAQGELLSSSLGAAFLCHSGLPTQWVDARDYLIASPLPNQNARTRLLSAMVKTCFDPVLERRLTGLGEVFITQGFIARDDDAGTVLLGRGGSDTSASCFGALLQASRVEIWTDVAGMFSADPRQVPGARLLKKLDYEEAQEIVSTGARVLHPRCLSPLREPCVPLLVKDTNQPELEGTVIGPGTTVQVPSIKAISTRKGITLVSMESIGMWQQVGFLVEVFKCFRNHGLSVDLIGSAETNVTVSLDPTENLLDSDAVAALAGDLARVCRVRVIAPCAAITLIGRGMRSMLHLLSSVLAEFNQLRVHLISQSSNNLNLTFVVDEGVVDSLIPHLHELLIAASVLRTDDCDLFGASWQSLYGTGQVEVSDAWWRHRAERKRLLDLGAQKTPRYIYHLPTVRAQARALKSLTVVDRLYYAVKANTHPAILKVLAAEGLAFECVSPGELDAVTAVIPGQTPLLFTPNFASRTDFARGLASHAILTLDALYPVEHWGEKFRGRQIALRLDLGRGQGHHEKVRTGGSGSKFGLPVAQLDIFLRHAEIHGIEVLGLHAHLGSGILDPGHWREVYSQLASLAEGIGSVAFLNIGGGLGVPSHPGEAAVDLEALNMLLGEVKAAYPHYQLWMEPGRYLVADAGVLLTRVTQTKGKDSWRYMGVDTGMNSLIRPALYDAWHEICNLSRLQDPATGLFQVVGPICETGDILGRDRRLPEPKEDDVILIAQVGAYGKVMASTYNLRGDVEEVVLEDLAC